MKKNRNLLTPMILVMAVSLAVLLGLLDAETKRFVDLLLGDSGANFIALIIYTILFALIFSFFRIISTYLFQVSGGGPTK